MAARLSICGLLLALAACRLEVVEGSSTGTTGGPLACSCPEQGPCGPHCDDGGLCVYTPNGTKCGTTCSDDMLTVSTCDGAGGCLPRTPYPCPGNASCTGNSCSGSCNADGGCALNFICVDIVNDQGICVPNLCCGPCNGDNAECNSGLCAPNGVCCRENCPHDQFPECSIVACTADAGASCVYPPPGNLCDTANETCTGSTLNAGTCDGTGTCVAGAIPCPNNYACNLSGTDCVRLCEADINCAEGFHCNNAGECVQFIDGGSP